MSVDQMCATIDAQIKYLDEEIAEMQRLIKETDKLLADMHKPAATQTPLPTQNGIALGTVLKKDTERFKVTEVDEKAGTTIVVSEAGAAQTIKTSDLASKGFAATTEAFTAKPIETLESKYSGIGNHRANTSGPGDNNLWRGDHTVGEREPDKEGNYVLRPQAQRFEVSTVLSPDLPSGQRIRYSLFSGGQKLTTEQYARGGYKPQFAFMGDVRNEPDSQGKFKPTWNNRLLAFDQLGGKMRDFAYGIDLTTAFEGKDNLFKPSEANVGLKNLNITPIVSYRRKFGHTLVTQNIGPSFITHNTSSGSEQWRGLNHRGALIWNHKTGEKGKETETRLRFGDNIQLASREGENNNTTFLRFDMLRQNKATGASLYLDGRYTRRKTEVDKTFDVQFTPAQMPNLVARLSGRDRERWKSDGSSTRDLTLDPSLMVGLTPYTMQNGKFTKPWVPFLGSGVVLTRTDKTDTDGVETKGDMKVAIAPRFELINMDKGQTWFVRTSIPHVDKKLDWKASTINIGWETRF